MPLQHLQASAVDDEELLWSPDHSLKTIGLDSFYSLFEVLIHSILILIYRAKI